MYQLWDATPPVQRRRFSWGLFPSHSHLPRSKKVMEVPIESIAEFLDANHYLGAAKRGTAWKDEFGVLVLANPSSRRLPLTWLELTRWCLLGTKNGGSQQWKNVTRWIRTRFPEITTIVSYSDPSAGHSGSLYRACNWLWAPTWHRLRPPPSGNGNWGTGRESVKDRWVYCLRDDAQRISILSVKDGSIEKKMPWASFKEKTGGDFKRWKNTYAIS